ncbi:MULTISPECIES: glycosyltransferase [unclassified Cryobacterium]|uniref:glycosyltransferase n=1 Tax=unclassified Cryobacterium TaxID=2649013 RepID=UPI00141B40C4|nr:MULTISPECIES: glycosyltransferase [unclassified Cryobacterium]
MTRNRTGVVFVHSSNEMYGADKVLLQVLKTLPEADKRAATVWLPDDAAPSVFSLDAELKRNNLRFEIRALPILRRKYLSPRHLPKTLMMMIRTLLELRRLKPHTVYMTTSASLAVGILARILRVPHVVLHCQEVWRGREAHVLGALATAATECLCISNAAQDGLRGRVRRRSRVFLNGVSDYDRPLVDPIARGGVLKFLVASRWNSWKGHSTLLEAWDSGEPLGELVVVGGPPEMGKPVDVRGIVSRMKNRESVVIQGEVQDISALVDAVDFVVVPSDEPEPFGLIAIEAFARGRAVIGSDGGGLSEIVDDAQTGRLFPLRDSAALRSIMQDLDSHQAQVMGAAARDSYLRSYSIEAFNSRFSSFWSEILPPAGAK